MRQLPGLGDTNVCPECRSLRCTCGPKRPSSPVPKLSDEIEYAVETFEDENDRKPNEAELKTITDDAREKVDSAAAAWSDYKATGAFVCEECGGTHYHHAPPACCRAHNYDDDVRD